MQLFYCPDIISGLGVLSTDESMHCVKVLRYKAGEPLQVLDGKGHLFHARITQANARACEFSIEKEEHLPNSLPCNIHIAIAPTKSIDRFEWFVEKATEIGISQITPLLCEHSERKSINIERVERIAISAMKQSVKAYLPEIAPMQDFKSFLETHLSENNNFIAHCIEQEKRALQEIYHINKDVLILIGPEGDFSPTEVTLAEKKGFKSISLGQSRLRTETAGIIACHSIHLLCSK